MLGTPILPLALTVMLGPQMLVAILLLLRKNPIKSSLVYLLSVVTTLILSTTLANYILLNLNLHHQSHSKGIDYLRYVIIILLLFSIIKNFLNRKKLTETPKWLRDIKTIPLTKVFTTGVMLIAFMPADVATIFTVGGLIIHNNGTILSAIPFFSLVALITSLPLLIYLSMGKSGYQNMEKANKWLNSHGWVINILIYSIFIYLILS